MKTLREIISSSIIKWFFVIMIAIEIVVGTEFIYLRFRRFIDYSERYMSQLRIRIYSTLEDYRKLVGAILSGEAVPTILNEKELFLWYVFTKDGKVVESNLEGLEKGDYFSPPINEYDVLNLNGNHYLVLHRSNKNIDGFVAINLNVFKGYVKMSYEESFIVGPRSKILMSSSPDLEGKSIAFLNLDLKNLKPFVFSTRYTILSTEEEHGLHIILRLNMDRITDEMLLSIAPLLASTFLGLFILSFVISRVITQKVSSDIERLTTYIEEGKVEEFETDIFELKIISEALTSLMIKFGSIQNMLLMVTSYNFEENLEERDLFLGALRNLEEYIIPLMSGKIASIAYYVREGEKLVKIYERRENKDAVQDHEMDVRTIEELSQDLSTSSIWEKSNGKTFLKVPLKVDDELSFLVSLLFLERLTHFEVNIGNLLAVSYNIAAKHANTLNKLSLMATTDYLTGLKNRQYFMMRLEEECSRAERYSQERTFAVSMIDVDGLKKINDTYGHDAGDILLKTFANFLRRITRKSDVVGRIGGDEFAVIWLNVRPEDVKEIEGKFLRELSKVRLEKYDMNLSASIGTAVYGIDAKVARKLLKIADERMYTMKMKRKAGRR